MKRILQRFVFILAVGLSLGGLMVAIAHGADICYGLQSVHDNGCLEKDTSFDGDDIDTELAAIVHAHRPFFTEVATSDSLIANPIAKVHARGPPHAF